MKRLLPLLALVAIYWLWPSSSEQEVPRVTDGGDTLFDRVWIDHLPKQPKEKIDVFIALQEVAALGVFERTSAYEGEYSLFEWTKGRGKGRLDIKMLQSDKKSALKYRVTRDCAPFDVCMELSGGPHGKKRYGSMRDWVIKGSTLPASSELCNGLLQRSVLCTEGLDL